ncbi:hypothetical protein MtrunA17_Chr7g0241971 [Medicago truncatula]|uniref:DUF247 domain protein n=1 Tax=Medicago truncatula TaxID=3880 RepID=A0A396GZ56_MEDTR|nr:hypothetical protein MtrunA17_Chr7g0241971 [Medicago truncatula]
MNTLLNSVDHEYIQSCSISLVPVEFVDSTNEEAYVPRVVSMGPRYKGREELVHMEEIKLRCMLALIDRVEKNDVKPGDILEKCSKVIWDLNDQIRASYVEDISLEVYELVKIMLVDGCFLLELLITKELELDSQLSSQLNFTPCLFAPQVLKNDDVLLQAAGVSIQLAENNGVTGLDFEFQFEKGNGKLQIAALYIRKTTKAKWRNVIFWEHHKMDWKKLGSNKGNDESKNSKISNSGTCGKFTSAALIFNDLICCADDVKILKDKNIIVDHMKMSNKEFIRTMSSGVDHGIVGSDYVKMVEKLNDYSTVFLLIRIWKKLRHYFTYYFEWFFKFMKRDNNFIATVVSFATLVQAVYAIIAYHTVK